MLYIIFCKILVGSQIHDYPENSPGKVVQPLLVVYKGHRENETSTVPNFCPTAQFQTTGCFMVSARSETSLA